MFNLRKLLSKSSKIQRNRRLLLNLQISFVAWAVELIGGIVGSLMIFLPFANVSSRLRQMVTDTVYFVILPIIYTVNNEDTKIYILQSTLYLKFTNFFFNGWVNKIAPANDNDPDLEKRNTFCELCEEEMYSLDHKENCTPFKNYPEFNVHFLVVSKNF